MNISLANAADLTLVELGILPPESVRRITIEGVADTGATRLVVPQSVVDRLGLKPFGTTTVRFADQRSATRSIVRNVSVEILGRRGDFTAVVEPNRETVLIGAIVMEDLDLLADCSSQTLRFRDPDTIITEVE